MLSQTSLDILLDRIDDIALRGIIFNKEVTFENLYYNRIELYKKYADLTINCDHKNINEIFELINNKL